MTQFVVLSMLLAILDHAYEDVREELVGKIVDDDTRHFNEDFSYVVGFPVTAFDWLIKQVVQKSSGTSVDFGKLRERRRVDPAMLHVLKFEKRPGRWAWPKLRRTRRRRSNNNLVVRALRGSVNGASDSPRRDTFRCWRPAPSGGSPIV